MTTQRTADGPGRLTIDVLTTDPAHPVNASLERWAAEQAPRHDVRILRRRSELQRGDLLFLVSCLEIIPQEDRERYTHCLVLHGSDLPEGRGMSPIVWQVLEGRRALTLTLLEAEDEVDSGRVWRKEPIALTGYELYDEINALVFEAETKLMTWAVGNVSTVRPRPQEGTPTVYPRRRPADSQLDPDATIREQFDLLRVSDPDRYPAFMELDGHRFTVRLERSDPS